ncbi:MAG: 50S ribosomal protein L24 [Chloroflexi bacterium CFX4]|nr:50S ribosomal protein L24 [Chloroflexi bacterium CFX4]MDL1921755.1 50S ribosomal protein L24 [Chloroflexi bacterium CFX3]
MQRIKKGDTVEVIAGKDIGQRGEVLSVLPKVNRVVVEKVSIVKKHQKQQQTRSGVRQGIVQFEAPIDLSNVMLVCKACDQRTRVGFRVDEEGKKVRVCKKCGQDVD